MNGHQLTGLPLDQALSVCAEQGLEVRVIETRSPRSKPGDDRSARVVAVRQDAGQYCLVVAFFSNEGPKEAEHAAG